MLRSLAGLAWCIVFCGLFLGVGVASFFGGHEIGKVSTGWIGQLSRGLLAIALMTVVTWLVRVKLNNKPWEGIALPRPQLKLLTLGALCGAITILAVFGCEYALGWLHFARISNESRGGIPNAVMIFVQLLPSLGTGFYEELAFRGYVLQTMGERTQLWIAIGVSSVLFSAVHLSSGSGLPWNIAASIALLGVMFALMRFATGSLWFPIGFHAMFDWTQTFPLGMSGDAGHDPSLMQFHLSGPPLWASGDTDFGLLYLFAVLIATALTVAFVRRTHRGPFWRDQLTTGGQPRQRA